MFNILSATFVEILKNEWLGIVASAFVLISFLMTKQTWIRIINIIGCVVFVVYGLILPAYSTAFMNAALIVVHVVYLTRDAVKARKSKQQQQSVISDDTDGTANAEQPSDGNQADDFQSKGD